MERVLASRATLIRQLAITSHNTITNRTLHLSLDRTIDITLERRQRIDQAAVEDGDSAERDAQPGLPLLFVDGDAVDAFDVGVGQRKGRWERDAHRHCLFVDEIGRYDFAGTGIDFDAERRVGIGFRL